MAYTPEMASARDLWHDNQAARLRDWANSYLKQRDMEVENMSTAWSDGLALINLIEIVSGRPMARYVKHPRFKGQKMDNFKVAIDAMESIYNTKIIGISAADLVEGNAKQTMGLVFLLASHVSKSKKHDEELRAASNTSLLPLETQGPLYSPRGTASPRTRSRGPQHSPFRQRRSGENSVENTPRHESCETSPEKSGDEMRVNVAARSAPRLEITQIAEEDAPSSDASTEPASPEPEAAVERGTVATPAQGASVPVDSPLSATIEAVLADVPQPSEESRGGSVAAEATAGAEYDVSQTTVQVHRELMQAIKTGDVERVQYLLGHPKCDPTYKDSECIRVASETGQPAVLDVLLEDKRADPAAKGNSAITYASWNGHTDVVARLLRDARVDPAKLIYAMQGAVDAGHLSVVQVLLADARVDPTALNNYCIRSAAERGHVDIVRLLLTDERVDVDAESGQARAEAEKRKHTEVVALIDEHLARKRAGSISQAGSGEAPQSKKRTHSKKKSTGGHHKHRSVDKVALTSETSDDGVNVARARSDSERVARGTGAAESGQSPGAKKKDRRKLMEMTKQLGVMNTKKKASDAAVTSDIDAAVREELLTRLEGKSRELVRLQAAWRGALARGAHKKQCEERMRRIKEELTADGQDGGASLVVRVQALIRGRLTRFDPIPELKKLRRRYNIAREILTSEETYVKGLYCLTKIYLAQLKQVPADVLPPDTLKQIFSNSEVIYGFNNVMLNQIRTRMNRWYTEGMKIGDIFAKVAEFMKVYTAYVNNYNDAFKVFTDYTKIPEVAEALQRSRDHPDVRGADLMNFLILPVQRLPRYVLLLKDLLKYTDEGHVDYANLAKAVEKMSGVADYVNEKKREAENLNAVMHISKHIVAYDKEKHGELAISTRHYVRQSPLDVIEQPQVSRVEQLYALEPAQFGARYVFLFNDLILFTTVEKRKDEERSVSVTGAASYAAGIMRNAVAGTAGKVTAGFKAITAAVGDITGLRKEEKSAENETGSSTSVFAPAASSSPSGSVLAGTGFTSTFDLDALHHPLDVVFRYVLHTNLAGLEVLDLGGSPTTGYRFALKESQNVAEYGVRVPAVFAAPTAELKEQWIQDLDDACSTILKAQRTRYEYDQEKEEKQNPGAHTGVAIKGTLYKRAPDSTWKKRYFALVGSELRQYASSSALERGDAPDLRFSILNCNVTIWPVADRECCFQIAHPKYAFLLAAGSGTERLQWINAIRSAIRFHLRDIKRRNLIAQEDFVNKVISEASSEASTGSWEKDKKEKKAPRIGITSAATAGALTESTAGSASPKAGGLGVMAGVGRLKTLDDEADLTASSEVEKPVLVEKPAKASRKPSDLLPGTVAKTLEENKSEARRRREMRRAATQSGDADKPNLPESITASRSSKYGTLRPSKAGSQNQSQSQAHSRQKTIERQLTKSLPLKLGELYRESSSKPGKFRKYTAAVTKNHLSLLSSDNKKLSFGVLGARKITEPPAPITAGDAGKQLFAVRFQTSSHSERLACTSLDEMNEWVAVINTAIDKASARKHSKTLSTSSNNLSAGSSE